MIRDEPMSAAYETFGLRTTAQRYFPMNHRIIHSRSPRRSPANC